MQLLAAQAALAIRNRRFLAETQKRSTALMTLIDAGNTITRSLSRSETLQRIAEQALIIIGSNNDQQHLCFRQGFSKAVSALQFRKKGRV